MNNPYVQLARLAVSEYLKNRQIIAPPSDLPKSFFSTQKGVFVTLYKKEELKGCIGTYLPRQKNIASEIIENAVAACSKDYRFKALSQEDLPYLRYEVSLLSKPQPVRKIQELDPQKYGVLVFSSAGRSGLLLPKLKEVTEIEDQLMIACQKGGINPAVDKITIFRFTTEVFK